jgi:hypothetical protein
MSPDWQTNSDGSEHGPSERDVEDACVDTCKGTEGMVLAMFSPQNIDRLVAMYRACLRSGRDLVIDLYTAAITAATGRYTIPRAGWDRVRVYLPRSQKARVIREQAFDRTEAVKLHLIEHARIGGTHPPACGPAHRPAGAAARACPPRPSRISPVN